MFPAFARFSENVTTFAPRYGNNETLSDSGRSTSRFLAKGQTVPVVGLFISGDSFGIAFFFCRKHPNHDLSNDNKPNICAI